MYVVSFRDTDFNYFILSTHEGEILTWKTEWELAEDIVSLIDIKSTYLSVRIVHVGDEELDMLLPQDKKLFFFNYNRKLFWGVELGHLCLLMDRCWEVFTTPPRARILAHTIQYMTNTTCQ